MQHLAIMKKSLGYLEKIKSGQKIIESRWYISKRAPWNKIRKGDTVYFKNSGYDVSLKSKVKKVLQFENLTPKKTKEILNKFGKRIGIENNNTFFKGIKDKKYCVLIFLENTKEIPEFTINKKGFGMMSAWITLEDINKIKIKNSRR